MMKQLEVSIDGKTHKVWALRQGGVIWAHVNGRTVVFEPEGSRVSKNKQKVEDPKKIFAPMPGKIVKVLCKKGDSVSKEQTLIVMEAMKMEYSLKIHAAGVVKKLNVSIGSQAGLGDLLAEVE